jgi:DNA-binding CsgD family transcriptional regulator/lipopolysaccharide biosynthesis regulator YciM
VTSSPNIVGRADDLALLQNRIGQAHHGQGRFIVIEGEAGAGKTTLLNEAVAAGERLGFHVVRGAGHEIDRDRPFGVIVDALAIRSGATHRARSSVARSLKAAMTAGFDESRRYSLVEDILGLIERDALVKPLLIALDDLQWADDSTLLVLNHLCRRIAHMPVCVVATRRPGTALSADQFEEVAADPATDRLRLSPLSEEDVALLATQLLGVTVAPGLKRLLAKTGGNPFFVTELLAALREDRSIDFGGSAADVALVDARPELRMVILRRLRGLAAETTSVVRMASVLGETFSARDLAIALGLQPLDLVRPLDEAVSAGVIHTDQDRLAFRHDLVREALYGDIPISMRNALHLQVGHALDGAGAAPVQTAPHYAAGAAFGDDVAIDRLRRAAADVAATEPEAARRWLARSLELMEATDPRHDAIVFDLGTIALRLGDAAAAERLARAALARPQPGDRRAALSRTLAAALDQQDRCLDAAAISEAESHAPGLDETERVRLAAEAVEYRGHVERVSLEGAANEVLERAVAADDDIAVRCVLAALYHAAIWRGAFDEAVSLAERIASRPDPADRFIVTTGALGGALARAGRSKDARAVLRADVVALEARRDVRQLPLILTELAAVEVGEGDWDAALSNVEAALGLAAEFHQEVRHDEAAALLASLATRRGEHDRAARILATLYSTRQFVASVALAKDAEANGDRSRALTILRDAWALADKQGRRSDLPRYAPDLIRLELALGEVGSATGYVETIEQLAQETRVALIVFVARRCRGLVKADADLLLEAAEDARLAGWIDERATTLEDAGGVLAEAGRRVEAIAALQESLAYYERVGAVFDARRTEATLRGLGARRGRRGPRAQAQTGWAALSKTEREVVQLAADGMTNSEIGGRLFISGRTVERHLTHVYAKLGVGSRVELATATAAAGATAASPPTAERTTR